MLPQQQHKQRVAMYPEDVRIHYKQDLAELFQLVGTDRRQVTKDGT